MRRLALIALLLATLTGCSDDAAGSTATGDYPWYGSVDELYAKATLVIEGAAGPGENVTEQGVPYTRYAVTVSRVWKGTAGAGDVVEVKRVRAEEAQFDEGGRYLLFLETYPDSPASTLNPDQGQYALDAAGAPVSRPANDVAVTVADLTRLRAAG